VPRGWLLFAIVGLVVGLSIATQRAPAPEEEVLEPLGLPGVREYRTLVVDRVDPAVLLLGTERGIFRTRDGGVRWYLAGLDGRSVDAIERRGNGYVAAGDGFTARGDAGGETWRIARVGRRPRPVEPKPRTENGLDIVTIAESPSEPGVLFAIASDGQLYRSSNAGATWQVAG
jgi:hypothetical protein